MKISAIDIGSNSVRLATFADGKTLYKRLVTTRLGEGLSATGILSEAAIERSVRAVAAFYEYAVNDGSARVYAFATAAVRSAENGAEFVQRVRDMCGLTVDVVSGEKEASLALAGALQGKDGAVIDIGGASTEITVQRGGKVVFSKSVDIGAVRLLEATRGERKKLDEVIPAKLEEYVGLNLAGVDVFGVSGTPTTLAAIKHKLTVYDGKIVHGTVLTAKEIEEQADKLLSMTVEEIKSLAGVDKNRADIIGCGSYLLSAITKKFGVEKITVSESDNLEGYVLLKEGHL